MNTRRICGLLILAVLVLNTACTGKGEMEKPNIVIILADDLGYGDVSCFNKASKIHTVQLDRLAEEGMMFTDAHSGSSVCTPTRYGLLTGRYAWRSRLKKGVLWSYNKHLIDAGRETLASLLKRHGYHTACIGKWHLGLDWAKDETGELDFFGPIANGPTINGFDYFYGITASLDIPPYFYIKNDRITATRVDTIEGMTGKKLLRRGPGGDDFEAMKVLPRFTEEAVDYIHSRSQSEEPFFLYFPLPAPHTPVLPTAEFLGKSESGDYGDFVLMVDDVLGQVMNALRANEMVENTLIFFTSDNGFSPYAGLEEQLAFGHTPNYIFRGHKADIYEGGHRVPFIASWPGKIKAGTTTDETICLTDFLATFTALMGDELADHAGEDSYDILPLLLGDDFSGPIREATIHHSADGFLSIRKGKWKMEFCPGSGGWSYPTHAQAVAEGFPAVQLYNLEQDPAEQNNIHEAHPEIVNALTELMQKYVADGRSTPGEPQQNDGITSYMNKY